MGLEQWGYSSFFSKQAGAFPGEPGRVVLAQRQQCVVMHEHGEALVHDGGNQAAAGDWVLVERGRIQRVLERRTLLSRARHRGEQVLAANVDTLLVVTGLDGDFNLRRMERYLVLAAESGADPVLILNKADLCEDTAAAVAQARSVAGGCPVLLVSAQERYGFDALEQVMEKGRTAALIGSSGAGKSTLVNSLLGRDAMLTQPVREHDSRGRHTTTARQMFQLPWGALLIDMPGLREVGLWASEESVQLAFPEIAGHVGQCRFRDCRHEGEPGCTVVDQVDAGRLASFQKLRREVEWQNRQNDPLQAAAHRKKMRAIHKAARDFYKE